MSDLESRLQRLEAVAATLPDVPQEATDGDALEYIRAALRGRQVIFAGGSWAINPGVTVGDMQWLCDMLNDYGAPIVPMTATEADRAIAELDAGAWFWQSGLRGPWPTWGHPAYDASGDLAGIVRVAARSWCEQTGESAPESLDELRAWLASVRAGVESQWAENAHEGENGNV